MVGWQIDSSEVDSAGFDVGGVGAARSMRVSHAETKCTVLDREVYGTGSEMAAK